ncbi:MAG: hypothetical protein E7600_04035 [Ruminococcaceae bacterium]|nr:hypothetical protein [Oscillospiraceae bacterium]
MDEKDVINNNEEKEQEQTKKRFSKTKIVILSIAGTLLTALIIFIAAFVVPNWGNIKAAWIWMTTSKEDISKNITAARQTAYDAAKNAGYEMNEDIYNAYINGKITEQQMSDIVAKKYTLEEARKMNSVTQSQQTQASQTVTFTPSKADAVEAYERNEITADQLSLIMSGEKTLDEVKSENQVSENTDVEGETQDNPESDDGTNNTQIPGTSESSNGAAFSQDALDAYKKGEISDSQLAEIGNNNKTLDQAKQENTVQTPQPNTAAPTSPPAQSTGQTVDDQIAALITRMYVLKAEYEGKVAGIVEQMKADYSKLPAEQRNKTAKSNIATEYMGVINQMEAQCDGQVDIVVTELRTILKDNGRDTALADAIVSTYATEKENTKAYYLSTYGD